MKKKTIFAGNDILTNGLGLNLILIAISWGLIISLFWNTNPAYAEAATLIRKIVFTIMALLTAPYLFFYFKNQRFATMDEKGIKFWCLFGNLGFVPWESITNVELRYIYVYEIKPRHFITKTRWRFYVISNINYHVLPNGNLNPKYGGIARTIPYRTRHFTKYLEYYRPDLIIKEYE